MEGHGTDHRHGNFSEESKTFQDIAISRFHRIDQIFFISSIMSALRISNYSISSIKILHSIKIF